MAKTEIEKYFMARAKEIQVIAKDGTPWGFLCGAAFLDCLSKLAEGQDRRRQGYKDFVRKYLKAINPAYSAFKYANGKADLPEQLYHVFRCGILHSFSLVPDATSAKQGGRRRSIVLCHRKEAKRMGITHLSRYSTPIIPDACVFVAEDFVKDLKRVTALLFGPKARKIDPDITTKMKTWVKQQPPIAGGF
jgi:hypothetical protein